MTTKMRWDYQVQVSQKIRTNSRRGNWKWRIVDRNGLVVEEANWESDWPRADSAARAGRHALADLLDPVKSGRQYGDWRPVHDEHLNAPEPEPRPGPIRIGCRRCGKTYDPTKDEHGLECVPVDEGRP